jgi:hypothetical protein
MNSPAEDVSAILALSSSATGLTEGTDLFISREPSSPDVVVTVFDTGGGEPASTDVKYEFPTVQVRARGTAITGYSGVYSTLDTVKGVLHKFKNQTINSTKYIGIWASSDIISLGYDSNERPILTLNFRIHRTA